MERNRDIRLNPELPSLDMKEGGAGNKVPLSDLYGLPVFAAETGRKEWELHIEESRRLGRIRQEIFGAKGKEEERLWKIRRQIFQSVSGEQMQEYSVSDSAALEDSTPVCSESGLAITALLFMVTVAGIMNFLFGRRKTSRKKLNRRKK